jgi:hypothetical protein
LTLHAKKAAEEASSKALEASKHAAGAGKNTFDDLSYVGKSTLGDLTKTAKEAAAKKGLMKHEQQQQQQQFSPQQSPSVDSSTLATTTGNSGMIAGTGRDFFSSIGSDLNGIAQSTSGMFSGLFGQKKAASQQPQRSAQPQQQQQKPAQPKPGLSFDPFPGRKGLVEKNPLIRHSGPKQTQEELQRMQNAERNSSDSENQVFLKDVINQVVAGEGVGWLKLNRLKKLMEDESYRTLVLSKLNKTLDRKIAPDDHIDDVVSRNDT